MEKDENLRLLQKAVGDRLSRELGVAAEELAAALESGAEVESLYQAIYQSEGSEIKLLDRLAEKNDFQEPLLNRMVLEKLLAELPEKERTLILLRYFQDKTQTQVAEVLGISQVQVSRLEKKILRKLRAKL